MILCVVTDPFHRFNSTSITESSLLTLSKILVADVLCARDSARYWGRCPSAEKCLLLEQSREVQAPLEGTGSTGNTSAGTTGVLWDCAGGREMEDGLEGPSQPSRSPELVRCISSCLSKTSHPEFLNYWSLYFSYFVLSESSIIILLVTQTCLNFFLTLIFALIHTQHLSILSSEWLLCPPPLFLPSQRFGLMVMYLGCGWSPILSPLLEPLHLLASPACGHTWSFRVLLWPRPSSPYIFQPRRACELHLLYWPQNSAFGMPTCYTGRGYKSHLSEEVCHHLTIAGSQALSLLTLLPGQAPAGFLPCSPLLSWPCKSPCWLWMAEHCRQSSEQDLIPVFNRHFSIDKDIIGAGRAFQRGSLAL